MENTYLNPVYPYECADPYAYNFNGSFWCYRTGHWQNGQIFGILRSPDLVHWEAVSGAMDPLPEKPPFYWAPEVHYENGVFYLYYSAGNEVNMHLRVATSQRPEGPFVDSGHQLTREVFAIDGHVFVDEDGQRYFFYATDFLEIERVGTGTVVDRMIDPFTLEGNPTPVSLAKYDWQIYDPRRAEKNNQRWHTVEGSFALKRKGRYYQMFSGGNYQQKSYGVGYAVTKDIRSRTEWDQHIDGEHIFPILRTVPAEVTGPGHNSVVAGPDHRQMYCVYHVIKPQKSFERVLSIDRLEWVGDRLVVLGPSYTPRPAPIQAQSLAAMAPQEHGTWQVSDSAIALLESGSAVIEFPLEHPAFLFHGWMRLLPGSALDGKAGITLNGPAGKLLRFSFEPAARSEAGPSLEITLAGSAPARLALPASFDPLALHRWKIDANCREIAFQLDEIDCTWKGRLPTQAERMNLWTEQAAAKFASPEITYGCEDSFANSHLSLEASGWVQQGDASWKISGSLLMARGGASEQSRLVKQLLMKEYEWVVNFRVVEGTSLWLFPAVEPGALGTSQDALQVQIEGGVWRLHIGDHESVSLPPEFDGYTFQQLRVRKQGGQIKVDWLDQELGAWPSAEGETLTALGIDSGSSAEFDMVRLTRL